MCEVFAIVTDHQGVSMTTGAIPKPTAVLTLVLLAACGPDSAAPPLAVDLQPSFSFQTAGWTAPQNLGATINTTAGEMNATFSPDELSLYFTSDRAGGLGVTDIWISRRECVGCPWQTPVNAGAPINSAGQDAGPRFSNDGHLLFFQSDRTGSGDIYVTRRNDTNDDFAWGTPVLLGGDVNTATGNEQAADYLQSAEDGSGNLYFNRQVGTTPPEIFYAPVSRDGETRGPAVYVSELNVVTANDQHVTIRKDGRELFFSSNRTGGLGGFDLWTSTRRSVHEPWSPPVDLAAPLNTAATDQQPTLSADRRTLLFASNRTGGFGANDLWISTRSPSDR
jgi:Tol biopolymer transport system component